MTDPGPLLDLPAIFHRVTSAAPIAEMRRPYRGRGVVCAMNGIVAVEAPAACFDRRVLRRLGRRPKGMPDVDRLFRRWRGDGRTARLPGFDDDECGERRPVPVGHATILARWVAFLLDNGVRFVEMGRTPLDPVRFDCGLCEGLLMPCRVLDPVDYPTIQGE